MPNNKFRPGPYHRQPMKIIKIETEGDEQKRLIKEALKEWLDEKFSQFGKWSAMAFFILVFAGLVALVLWSQGWHK